MYEILESEEVVVVISENLGVSGNLRFSILVGIAGDWNVAWYGENFFRAFSSKFLDFQANLFLDFQANFGITDKQRSKFRNFLPQSFGGGYSFLG